MTLSGSRKYPAISTAWSSLPPGLFLRSRIKRLAPAALASSKAICSSRALSSENDERSTRATVVPDGQLDAGSLRSLDLLYNLRDLVTPDALSVDGQEHVVGTDPGLLGRRAVYRGGDHDLTILLLELDPDPHVRSRKALVVLLAFLWGQETGVPVVPKRLEHPFYGPVGLLLGIYVLLVYVVLPDGVERLSVECHAFLVHFIERGRTLRASDHVSPERRREHHNEEEEHPHHRDPCLRPGLGILPHAAIVSQHFS